MLFFDYFIKTCTLYFLNVDTCTENGNRSRQLTEQHRTTTGSYPQSLATPTKEKKRFYFNYHFNTSIECHKLVLSSASSYFSQLLCDSEYNTIVIDVTLMASHILRTVADFMYNSECS